MPRSYASRQAAAATRHGGDRTPAKPAAVSGPGALSKRTDGKPGEVQPITSFPAASQGQRQALEDVQRAAPMRSGGPAVPEAPTGEPLPPGRPAADPFGPSRRPNEPLTAGAELGAGRPAPSSSMMLRDRIATWFQETRDPMWAEMLEDLDAEAGLG